MTNAEMIEALSQVIDSLAGMSISTEQWNATRQPLYRVQSELIARKCKEEREAAYAKAEKDFLARRAEFGAPI